VVASLSGLKIFVLSHLPGTKYNVGGYFYFPAADVMEGDYAALLTFAAHYGHPIAIFQCPNITAFQASHPLAIIRPSRDHTSYRFLDAVHMDIAFGLFGGLLVCSHLG
jgi:hypothetical protein